MKTEILKVKGDWQEVIDTDERKEKLLKNVWRGIHRRCNSPKDQRYKNYGERGIRVCKEWDEFETFKRWAINNGYEIGLSIERINNDGNYCPENCKWASSKEQANNRTSNHFLEYNGEIHTIAEWSEITGIGQSAIWRRIRLDWNAEDVLTKPLRKTTIVYNGEEKSLAEWSRITGLNDGAISRRLMRGWDVEKALTKKSERGAERKC